MDGSTRTCVINPYLMVRDAARAIAFYQEAFGAKELDRLLMPDGKVAHAQIQIGGATVMLADENPDFGNRSPETLGGSPVVLHLDVPDVDAVFQRAVAAGARVLIPVKDQFYGDRSGRLADPFGHLWIIATHREDVSPEEMKRRFSELMSQPGRKKS